MPALTASSITTRRADLLVPSRSTRVCNGRARWFRPAEVITDFLIRIAISLLWNIKLRERRAIDQN